jgi:hypothetical protein
MRTLILLTAFAALGACIAQPSREAPTRAPAARVIGEAVSCIDTARIRESRVHDDYTIDYRMVGGETYRNTLPGRCAGLGFDRAFAYTTSVPRLCSSDIITVLHTDGGRGGSCGLGPFVPVELSGR